MCEAVVHDGLYDLALTVLPVEREFHTLELYSSPVLYWVRRDDPLAKKDSLDIHDLASRRIAIPGREFKCYQQLCRRFDGEGIDRPDILEHSEIFWIYEFVLHGGGLGFTLPHLTSLEVFSADPDVVAVPAEGFTWGSACPISDPEACASGKKSSSPTFRTAPPSITADTTVFPERSGKPFTRQRNGFSMKGWKRRRNAVRLQPSMKVDRQARAASYSSPSGHGLCRKRH